MVRARLFGAWSPSTVPRQAGGIPDGGEIVSSWPREMGARLHAGESHPGQRGAARGPCKHRLSILFGRAAAGHQFCSIGDSVMVAGHAAITRRRQHFADASRERMNLLGFNVVGHQESRLQQRAAIAEIKAPIHAVYYAGQHQRTWPRSSSRPTRRTAEAGVLEFLDGGSAALSGHGGRRGGENDWRLRCITSAIPPESGPRRS